MSPHLTARKVADMLDVKIGTLSKWRREGRGPKGWARVSKTLVIYPADEVDRFLESCRAALVTPAGPGRDPRSHPMIPMAEEP